ncbi:uL30 family ribosomal protein [Candidatus Woesearchaeota archaeon]|nr:uL30 family ribosomal protein [Candidatus Woesearchaeota archaeon]
MEKTKSGIGRQLAVIRLRGRTGLNHSVAVTLDLLNIRRVNHCAVVPDTPEVVGMVKKAKDYITWGPIDDDTLKAIVEKRGEAVEAATAPGTKSNKKSFAFNGKNYRPYFRLSPAKGGLGKRGIKASFTNSGALGDRKEKINDLIKKML